MHFWKILQVTYSANEQSPNFKIIKGNQVILYILAYACQT